MGDLARPALPEALAALTGSHVDEWRERLYICLSAYHGSGRGAGNVLCLPWTTTDPTDAAELFVTRGVLPESWHGDTRRGWYCASCGGRGAVTYQGEGGLEDDACGVCAVDDPDATGGVRLTGYTVAPAAIPDLVAVASLGWPAIQRAEELARAACHALREYGCPQPQRVVWRVGDRNADLAVWWDDRSTIVQALQSGWVQVYEDGPLEPPDRMECKPARTLWTSGLALDRITADAVVVVVPSVGGVR